jgi:hypothetical protein
MSLKPGPEIGSADFTNPACSDESLNDRSDDEFERINEKQNHEEKHAGQRDGRVVLETVAAKESELHSPHREQRAERDGERKEAAHGVQHFRRRVWHLERNHQQGDRKPEHRVAQSLDARDLLTP